MRPGLALQRDDAVAEIDRLLEIVGDEHDRRARSPRAGADLVLQRLPRHGVERAERLVHQQDLRVAAPGSARSARAAACRRKAAPGIFARGRPSPILREQLVDLGRALRARRAARLQCQRDIAGDRAPRQQRLAVVLEHDGVFARPGASPACRRTRRSPVVGFSRPATMRSSVVLPQPDGPTRQTNSDLRTDRSILRRIGRGPKS